MLTQCGALLKERTRISVRQEQAFSLQYLTAPHSSRAVNGKTRSSSCWLSHARAAAAAAAGHEAASGPSSLWEPSYLRKSEQTRAKFLKEYYCEMYKRPVKVLSFGKPFEHKEFVLNLIPSIFVQVP